jgi:hypothetical protein
MQYQVLIPVFQCKFPPFAYRLHDHIYATTDVITGVILRVDMPEKKLHLVANWVSCTPQEGYREYTNSCVQNTILLVEQTVLDFLRVETVKKDNLFNFHL